MPDGTPFYNGPTFLDSRDWTSLERSPGCMGEYTGERIPDNGEPPFVPPVPRLVGTADCLANGGGGGELTSDPTGLERFLPAGCYEPLTDSPCERIYRCPTVYQIANTMAAVNPAPNDAIALAQAIVGPGSVGTAFIPPVDDLYSNSVVCVLANEAWQWCDGTRNRNQLLAQAYGTNFGGRSYGPFSTTPIYWDYATDLLSRFTVSGAADCKRWVLIGHSYGGAAASVAAARLKLMYPDRDIALYTLGAPRAGDRRLIEILRGVCQTHIRRPDDPIPYLPPQVDDSIVASLLGLASVAFLRVWGSYEGYERRRSLSSTGFVDEDPTAGPTNSAWTSIITQIVSGVLTSYSDHNINLYASELATNCGMP